MAEAIKLQQLLQLQKKVWNFRVDRLGKDSNVILREQLKSIEQISRLGILVAIPLVLYIMIKLVMLASPGIIVLNLCYIAMAAFISIRNFRRPSFTDAEDEELHSIVQLIQRESILSAIGYSCMLAIPVAFGQFPMELDVAMIALGILIIGGFVYGSIPRAQTYYLTITGSCLVAGFAIAGGWQAANGVALFIFFGLCIDLIYRIFFFNFAQRHLHAIKLKNAADTVKLLLNDYAEQSSDWLWEVDSDLCLRNVTARFAMAAACEINDLNGKELVRLFEQDNQCDALKQALDTTGSFRDIILPIIVGNERRWWKLSGRPMATNDDKEIAFRGVATDISSAKLTEDRVTHLAHFDSLTDLPNRAFFNETLQRSIRRRRDDQMMAVLYLDLDHFKLVNDTLGHGAGDKMLKAVADRLETAIGIEGVVARLGGDEFAVFLCNIVSPEAALKTASEIIDKLSEPVMIEGQPVSSGISAGVALCPDHGNSAEDLLCRADIALYRSKKKGRGCVNMFTPDMLVAVEDRRDIELDLRSAIVNGGVELHYQPVINIETQEIVAYEALLRWTHPEKGEIPPDQFIPIAEESGIIVHLGEWVIRTALDEIRNWPDHLSVSVNLSPAQMRSSNLLPTIINALSSSGIASNRLELEITESVLMSDNQANINLLLKIHSLGIRIALDDFGTGYSSLNYLRSFPFDKIKIDRCFVEDVDSREDCRAIIRAVTGLASSLGMVTTAEGVERQNQLSRLKEEGCVQVQGYLFSKAVPATSVAGRIAPVKTISRADPVEPTTVVPKQFDQPELPAVKRAL